MPYMAIDVCSEVPTEETMFLIVDSCCFPELFVLPVVSTSLIARLLSMREYWRLMQLDELIEVLLVWMFFVSPPDTQT